MTHSSDHLYLLRPTRLQNRNTYSIISDYCATKEHKKAFQKKWCTQSNHKTAGELIFGTSDILCHQRDWSKLIGLSSTDKSRRFQLASDIQAPVLPTLVKQKKNVS